MESLADHSKARQTRDTCPSCGLSNTYTRAKSPHVGLYCAGCGRWIRWVARHEAAKFPAAPATTSPGLKLASPVAAEPTKPAAGACDHRVELDRLIRHLAGVERELAVVTRALMNGVKASR
jgi:hypothetical protein